MTVGGKAGEGIWTLNDKLPVVFGTGSMLELPGIQPGRAHHGDLPAVDVERVGAHRPDRIAGQAVRVLPERHGDQDLRRQGRHRAVGRQARLRSARRAQCRQPGIARTPRPALRRRPPAVGEGRLEGRRQRRAVGSAYRSACWPSCIFQLKSQYKSLKFIEPAQVPGSIDDLVGMDDIKAEVAQIKDQYQRRAEYAEYGISKPFNVMFSGPAGTGKTKLASYLAKELRLPDPVPLGGQPGDGLRRRRLEHVEPHHDDGQAAQALHRIPGRGAGPVHEARRPPQVRRRHGEHAAVGARRRAQQATKPRSSGSSPATSTAKRCRWTRPCCAASR